LRRYIDGLRNSYLSEQVLNNSLLHQAVKTALLRVDHFLFFMATNFVVTQKTRILCASRLIDESLRARLARIVPGNRRVDIQHFRSSAKQTGFIS